MTDTPEDYSSVDEIMGLMQTDPSNWRPAAALWRWWHALSLGDQAGLAGMARGTLKSAAPIDGRPLSKANEARIRDLIGYPAQEPP